MLLEDNYGSVKRLIPTDYMLLWQGNMVHEGPIWKNLPRIKDQQLILMSSTLGFISISKVVFSLISDHQEMISSYLFEGGGVIFIKSSIINCTIYGFFSPLCSIFVWFQHDIQKILENLLSMSSPPPLSHKTTMSGPRQWLM